MRFFYPILIFSFLFSCKPGIKSETRDPKSIDIIFPGDYPDPSILKERDDYYLTHSSFEHYPGLLIWRSKDLKNWEPVTRALTKYTGSVYAPDLVKHEDRFFIYFPGVTDENGWKVYVISAEKIDGPWSDPILVGDFWAIDPGFITDQEGTPFLHLNDGRAIELESNGLEAKGEVRQVYDGWPIPDEIAVECFCLESPKLLYKDGFYHLTSAQGGTAGPSTSHMAVSARSKTPLGPWENSPYNPVIHTWNPEEPWMSKGHGTIFEGPEEQWYIVYHGYERGFYTLGRQTLMEPIEWTEDGWYKRSIKDTIDLKYVKHKNTEISSDDFSLEELNLQWSFFGKDSYEAASLKNGQLIINAEVGKVKAVHCFVPDHNYSASAMIEPEPGVEAGLSAFYNEKYYVGIAYKDGRVFATRDGKVELEVDAPDAKYFKMIMNHHDLRFQYSVDGKIWKYLQKAYEVSCYNHNALGDFLSLKVGMYCTGDGNVAIDDFIYESL